jgi:hypothetical protein
VVKLPLLGTWIINPDDERAVREYGRVSLRFTNDGRLIHTIHDSASDQKLLLSYRVEGDTLVTNQPSAPREERTPFLLTPDGRLILSFGGVQSTYVRADPIAETNPQLV